METNGDDPVGDPVLEPRDTVEAWAADYIRAGSIGHKLDPGIPPRRWAAAPAPLRIRAPGRGSGFTTKGSTRRSLRKSDLEKEGKRAELFHTFLHHELQAAELMCWALLAFPETPSSFRKGLLGICQDEIRHMQLYAGYLAEHGCSFGDHPVRDWFWERVASCRTPLQFVALMGMGLEGGNLDHTLRYEEWFRDIGDRDAVRIQRVVCEEEVPHVRFAIHWFRTWTGGLDFDRWKEEIVAPLTPTMLQGKQIHRSARLASGFDEGFLQELVQWQNGLPGS